MYSYVVIVLVYSQHEDPAHVLGCACLTVNHGLKHELLVPRPKSKKAIIVRFHKDFFFLLGRHTPYYPVLVNAVTPNLVAKYHQYYCQRTIPLLFLEAIMWMIRHFTVMITKQPWYFQFRSLLFIRFKKSLIGYKPVISTP